MIIYGVGKMVCRNPIPLKKYNIMDIFGKLNFSHYSVVEHDFLVRTSC